MSTRNGVSSYPSGRKAAGAALPDEVHKVVREERAGFAVKGTKERIPHRPSRFSGRVGLLGKL